jgi:hypothetical protein
MTIALFNDPSLVMAMWPLPKLPHEGALPAIAAPYSHVECVLDRGNGWRARHAGEFGGRARPPTFVYSNTVGALRFEGQAGTLAIGFRVSPIVVSSLLSRPPAEIWNEPVALPDPIGSGTDRSNQDVQYLFSHALQNAPFEFFDKMSNQLGWSAPGLRRLFAKSAKMSAPDAQLIRLHLDGRASLRARQNREVDLQTGFVDHTSFAHSPCERIDSIHDLLPGNGKTLSGTIDILLRGLSPERQSHRT